MHVDCPPFGNRFFAMFWSIPICQNHKFGTRLPNLPLRLGKTNAFVCDDCEADEVGRSYFSVPKKSWHFYVANLLSHQMEWGTQEHPRSPKFIQIHPNSLGWELEYYEILWNTMKRGRAVDDVQLPTHLWRICSWAHPDLLLSAGFHHWHWWLLTSKRYQCCGNGRYNQSITWRHHWIHSQEVWSYRVRVYIYIYVYTYNMLSK